MIQFDHPYPRYGLAATLVHHNIGNEWEAVLSDEKRLARLAADMIDECLNEVRMHTEDDPEDETVTALRFRYLSDADLKTKGQKAEELYYMAPHVSTGDSGTNRLIAAARKFRDKLRKGEGLQRSVELKRSFSPFTAKINAGTKSLSNPKTTQLEAAFTLIATLTRRKPAAQVDFDNQVIVPDLDLKNLMRFVALFRRMQDSETKGNLVRELREGSTYYRPAVFNGNYPNAPRTPIFGPIGLMAAMGRWARRAGEISWAKEVLENVARRPLYLVSYNKSLMRQVHLGVHVAGLALKYDLPKVLDGLYRSHFYNSDDNKPGSKTRELFYLMAGRFLQQYTRPAFRDFLAFRVQYDASFSPILRDYFMSQRQLPEDLVRSARAYGAYLNRVAYFVAKDEVENKDTGRNLYEAKTRVLAQMESSAMSAKRPSALFARLNVDAGRMSNSDAPAEAERFIEAAIAGKEIDLDTAQELILAFMRLWDAKTEAAEPTSDAEKAATAT